MTAFLSARRKYQRAEKHYAALGAIVETFQAAEPVSAELVETEHGGEIRIRVHQKKVPDEIALAFGDCVHNLRSALDHIVYQAVGKFATTQTEWPIAGPDGRPPKDWRKRIDTRSCSGTAAAAIALRTYLYGLEPWTGGHEEWMWCLHRLDVIDKHRLLLTANVIANRVQSVQRLDVVQVSDDDPETSVIVPRAVQFSATWEPPNSGVLVDGTVFQEFTHEELRQLETLNITFGVGLHEPELPVGSRSLQHIASEFMEGVANVIHEVEEIVDSAPTMFGRPRPVG